MADYYTQFSEIVLDKLTEREVEWLEEELLDPKSLPPEERDKWYSVRPDSFREKMWPGFGWEIVKSPQDVYLWVYAEDYGDVPHVTEVLQRFLARFRPNEHCTMTWAMTCSKLHTGGEFSGGGFLVTYSGVEYIDVLSLLEELLVKREL